MSTRPRILQAALLLLGALSFAGCQSPSHSGPSSPMPPSPPSAPSPSSPSPPSSPSAPSSQPPSPSSPSAGQPSPQQQPAGQPSQPTASSDGAQSPTGGEPGDAGSQTADTGAAEGGDGSAGDTGAGASVDDDGVLAEAIEVFRRSAARSRSSEAPSEGDGADGGMGAPAGSRPAGSDGDAQGDLDDLVSGDLDDMIAGGGSSRQSPDAAAEGTEPGGDVAAGGGAGGEDAAGPWHQPGASGSGRAPTSEETYGDASGAEDEAGSGAGSQTAAERHAELERVLADAMGDFDGRILDERATILARRGNAPGTIEAAGRSDGGDEGEADRRGGRDTAGRRPVPPPPAPSSQQQPDGQSGSGTSRGSVGGGEVLPVPEDIGDGANDDVVARQLREAAMAETDPELREKLWDEYRRYVAGRR